MAVNLLGMQNPYLARLPNDHETACKHHLVRAVFFLYKECLEMS
jgi:hypothetical protein